MKIRRTVGPVTKEQFDVMTDEQLLKTIPSIWRPMYPGKEYCPFGEFYLHDGGVYDFFTGTTKDWND